MFKKIILENQKKIKEINLIERTFNIRELKEILKLNKIVAIIWPRRAGKTFLTFQIVKNLVKENLIGFDNIVFLDFSSFIEKDINLEEVENSYFSLFPDKKPFFIFDEIQELQNFPEKLITLLNKWYKIIITWSNAQLLSKELSTILRWKVYTKEVLPLDFKEYLKFKWINYSNKEIILNKAKFDFHLHNFLKRWWFPEIVLTKNELVKENILKTYFDIMLYKDLIDRYKIKQELALKYFLKRVLTNFSKQININKIYNELKSQNIKISKDTLYNFFEYVENIYLIFKISNRRSKIKWKKKIYLSDVSFANLIWNEDFWQRFENIIFLNLRKKYNEVFFLQKTNEIDFFIPKENLFIQVCYKLNFNNIDREIKPLKKINWKKFLIYYDIENWIQIPKDINLVNYLDFLISSNDIQRKWNK